MDKKEFFEKAETALNQAFEIAKKSAKVVAEKAGEAAQVTKLLVEKVTLEHQVNKQFVRLGGLVYEKAAREGKESLVQDPEVRSIVNAVKELEANLAQVEATLEEEKTEKQAKKSNGGAKTEKKFTSRRTKS